MKLNRQTGRIINDSSEKGDITRYADEPELQQEMLHNNLPVVVRNTLFYPLLIEFPHSPGIDIVFFSENCELLIAELKYKDSNIGQAQAEILNHYQKYHDYTVDYICQHPEKNRKEVNTENLRKFEERFQGEKYKTLQDLWNENRLHIACLVYGNIKLVNFPRNTDVISFQINETEICYDVCEGDTGNTDYQHMSREHEKAKRRNASPRHLRTQIQLEGLVDESDSTHMKSILEEAKRRGYSFTAGTGVALSFFLQIKDAENKNRTVLRVFEDGIGIPGNLYNQKYYLEVTADFLDELFRRVRSVFNGKQCVYADGGSLKIYLGDVSSKELEELFTELDYLRTEIGR